jgi:hypothetical protein
MGIGQWALKIENWALRIGFGRDSFHARCPMPIAHAHYPFPNNFAFFTITLTKKLLI